MDKNILNEINNLIDIALFEDLGAKQIDVTSEATISPISASKGVFNARQDLVFVGEQILTQVFSHKILGAKNIKLKVFAKDGAKIKKGQKIAEIIGNTKDILLLERVALNFIQYLSAIATQTAKFVELTKHTKAKILDTRKTLPAYRSLAKYAVKCGGGVNHRVGLYDAVLIKDNHIAAVGGDVVQTILNARKQFPKLKIEVEVDNLKQLNTIFRAAAGAKPKLVKQELAMPDVILLDNFKLRHLDAAVGMRDLHNENILLEASGGVNIKTVKKIAETGVDYISIGALTHSVTAVDIGLDFI
jgi:nicotinate-nucleotide pyrophosphorylase (carboxylating)